MIEIIKDVQLEISLIVIAVYILYSLKKEKSEGLITLASFVIAIIVWESSGGEIFSAGVAFVASLYMFFFGWSLATLKPHFKILSSVNTDILLFLGILLANEYASEYKVIVSKWALVIVVSYGLLALRLNYIGRNDKEGLAATTHTLKKGYLLNIEEIDKEISLLIITFFTMLGSLWVWGWLTPNETSIASSQLFNYQLSVFVLTLLMLIFSAVKFSLKRDELTKRETKGVELASRGRYGEYYGCSNTLLWETRRQSIRASLHKEFYNDEKDFDKKFFNKQFINLNEEDKKRKWDYYCQLASAYYSHAISLEELKKKDKDKDKDKDIQEYLLKAFYIYENLTKKYGYSDEYYHHIDLRNDLYLLSIEDSDKDDELRKKLKKFYTTTNKEKGYLGKLNQSTNYKFNKILEDLKNKTIDYDAAILALNNISEGLKDKKQYKAARKHKKTIELLSALINAHDYEKIKDWVKDFKGAKGHIDKNVEKFKAPRFDAPANLFITTTGVIISIVAIISILEIFDYSKVINIEIFALSGGALSMVFAFIFKNVIESFFAALQMYLSDMLRVGDRIKCEALSIDGYVSGFGFSSIDFQNLDNSHVKVPAKDLIEQTFSNLRTLPENGRRIEIKLTFSANSIKIFTSSDVKETQEEVVDMKAYLDCKLKSMSNFNCDKTVATTHSVTKLNGGETSTVTFTFSEEVSGFASADVTVKNGSITEPSTSDGGTTYTATYTATDDVTDTTNVITVDNFIISDFQCYKNKIDKKKDFPQRRFLSNLGSFRAYAEQYLFEHQWLNDGASPMVVIYDTSAEGVSVLFTAYSQPDDRFVRTKAFMNLQSDIVEHLITTSQYFGLKLHQSESESGAGVVEKSDT